MRHPVEILMEKYKNNIYVIAFNICKNSGDAEDVVQDTFIQYMSLKKDFETEEHIRAWLIRVAINKAKNKNISFFRMKVVPLEDYMETLTFESEESSDLFEAVMTLPEKYRITIHLFYYEDYSVNEIADIQKKIGANLKSAFEEESFFDVQIAADLERQKRLDEGDVVSEERKKENIFILLFKDLAKKRKVQEPVLEEVVIYQNDFSKLFAAPEETRAKGYASFEFEKSCVDGGIQGLITGKITVYGSYLSAAVTLYEYPGAREIGHATDVGGVDEIGFIAKRLASSLIPKISDSMPIEIQVSVKPDDAAAKTVLTVDDSVYRSIPETLVLGSGVHTLGFEAEGYMSASTSYSFTGNRRFSVEIEMREKKDGAFTLALKKDFSGDLFADGELAASFKSDERFTSIKINDGNILGRFISEDGTGADYFIKDSLVEDGAKLVLNANPFDRNAYIEKRRKLMYSSYSALIVSLIPTFYCYGNYFSAASAYNKRYDYSYEDAAKWQTASNVTTGISIACGAFFAYELTRYLLAANTVLPAEAKKMSPRREAKIRAKEEKARALAENADSEKKENTEELNTEESEISAPEKAEAAGD